MLQDLLIVVSSRLETEICHFQVFMGLLCDLKWPTLLGLGRLFVLVNGCDTVRKSNCIHSRVYHSRLLVIVLFLISWLLNFLIAYLLSFGLALLLLRLLMLVILKALSHRWFYG